MKKVLIACEESQAICIEMRKLWIEAYSCDILPCSGGHPEWHIQGDAIAEAYSGKYDMMIAHPPCTYLTVTGNRWFNEERYWEKAVQRKKDREWAIDFFMKFAKAPIEKIAIENPVWVMSTAWRKSDQIIQPFQFWHKEAKKTALWLKNLPKLIPTEIVEQDERVVFASGKSMPKWYSDAWHLPKEERSKMRSKTFHWIAKAIAEQWGWLLLKSYSNPELFNNQ